MKFSMTVGLGMALLLAACDIPKQKQFTDETSEFVNVTKGRTYGPSGNTETLADGTLRQREVYWKTFEAGQVMPNGQTAETYTSVHCNVFVVSKPFVFHYNGRNSRGRYSELRLENSRMEVDLAQPLDRYERRDGKPSRLEVATAEQKAEGLELCKAMAGTKEAQTYFWGRSVVSYSKEMIQWSRWSNKDLYYSVLDMDVAAGATADVTHLLSRMLSDKWYDSDLNVIDWTKTKNKSIKKVRMNAARDLEIEFSDGLHLYANVLSHDIINVATLPEDLKSNKFTQYKRVVDYGGQ